MIEQDELLVEEILQGKKHLYEWLVKKYQNKIFQLIYRMTRCHEDALDMTQETFIQAYRSLEQFRKEATFYTWLHRIAANKTLDFLRKKKRIVETGERVLTQFRVSAPMTGDRGDPESIAVAREEQLKVRDMLETLPDKYRIALVLNHYQEFSYQEIADIMEIPVKTVATRIYRARLLLKEKLVKGGHDS